MTKRAILAAQIFDGTRLLHDSALLLDGGVCVGVAPAQDIPSGYVQTHKGKGVVLPGFVDVQVNGGGGVMFNEDTSVEGLKTMAAAHASTGTRALLPTLITDTPDRTQAAILAIEQAIAQNVPGIVGLHLEGPHLSITRKGAHDPALIRAMNSEDLELLCDAAQRLPNLMVTVAPENVTPVQIERLSQAGVVVSLGHSDCTFAQAQEAFRAGACCVTHLFNAMSPLGHREPGLAGAALHTPGVSAGLIADDVHVHAASMQLALSAKTQPGAIFLVTDAMATAGSDITSFTLNGRTVHRDKGRLTLDNGTLAGADLDFPTALRILETRVGVPRERALAMATSLPASMLPTRQSLGHFRVGQATNAIYMDTSTNWAVTAV